jgi:hypothetical protein
MFNPIKFLNPLYFYINKKPINFINNENNAKCKNIKCNSSIDLYKYIIYSTNKYIKIMCDFNKKKHAIKYILNENDTVDKQEEINKQYLVLRNLFIISLFVFINL